MFGIGNMEILVIALMVILLFGPRLPGIMKSLGSALKQFREGADE